MPDLDAKTYVRHLERRLGAEVAGRLQAEAFAEQYLTELEALKADGAAPCTETTPPT